MHEPITAANVKPKIEQRIPCAAVVRLDDVFLEHGLLMIHPELPPIKLYLKLDLAKHTITGHHFEVVQAKHGDQTNFAIEIHEAAAPPITVPERKLIIPGV